MFEPLEESRARGTPVELFYFKYGEATDAFVGFTDGDETVTTGGVTYTPVPIARNNIKNTGTIEKSGITVSVARDNRIAELFRVYAPAHVVTLIVRQGHLNDPDEEFKVVWTGKILSSTRKASETEFTCEPVATSLKRSGLRRHYQYGCPHVLYGHECRADKAAATKTADVANVGGNTVDVVSGWSGALDPQKYLGGIVEWQGIHGPEYRTILRVSTGDVRLHLAGPTNDLSPGTTVKISLGCSRTLEDCGDLHNNLVNFGGQPWIPLKSPIKTNPYR